MQKLYIFSLQVDELFLYVESPKDSSLIFQTIKQIQQNLKDTKSTYKTFVAFTC